jgi:hydroxyethylthiazole kinase-like uncharacterized protein yjeF
MAEHGCGLEVMRVAEMGAADGAAIAAGTPGRVLMERAGAGVAQAITDRWSPRPVAILCGPGNNGGDGFVVARLLQAAGWPVTLALLGPREALRGDAALAAADWTGAVRPLDPGALDGAALVVDALFGAGLSKPLDAPVADLLRQAAARDLPIVAVDLPSGLPGDAPAPLDWAPSATLTVTFHRKKPAHLLQPGRSLCGEIVVVDIGLSAPDRPRLWENGPGLWLPRFPWPGTDAHKHTRGRLGVVAGDRYSTGAARLAARAGLRLCGAVTVLSPPHSADIIATHLEAAMLAVFASTDALQSAAKGQDAVIIGPAAGVGDLTAAHLEALARSGACLVVDADALTSFRSRPADLFALLDDSDVITPHPGEFERIFPGLLASSPDRLATAVTAAERCGATVILKGPDTVIAAPDGRAAINANGMPWLACAGSGDTLAGIVGALLAGGMPAWEAACAAVWMHADAAERFGPGLCAEDLAGMLPQVIPGLGGA